MPTPGDNGQGAPGGPGWPRGAPGPARSHLCGPQGLAPRGLGPAPHPVALGPQSCGFPSNHRHFQRTLRSPPPPTQHLCPVQERGVTDQDSPPGGPVRSTPPVSPPARPGHAAEPLPHRLPARGPLALAVPRLGYSVFTSPSPTLCKPSRQPTPTSWADRTLRLPSRVCVGLRGLLGTHRPTGHVHRAKVSRRPPPPTQLQHGAGALAVGQASRPSRRFHTPRGCPQHRRGTVHPGSGGCRGLAEPTANLTSSLSTGPCWSSLAAPPHHSLDGGYGCRIATRECHTGGGQGHPPADALPVPKWTRGPHAHSPSHLNWLTPPHSSGWETRKQGDTPEGGPRPQPGPGPRRPLLVRLKATTLPSQHSDGRAWGLLRAAGHPQVRRRRAQSARAPREGRELGSAGQGTKAQRKAPHVQQGASPRPPITRSTFQEPRKKGTSPAAEAWGFPPHF